MAKTSEKGGILQFDIQRWQEATRVLGRMDQLVAEIVPEAHNIRDEAIPDALTLCGYRIPQYQMKVMLTLDSETRKPAAWFSVQIDTLRFEVIFGGTFVVLIEGGYNPEFTWIEQYPLIKRILEITSLGRAQPIPRDAGLDLIETLIRAATGVPKLTPKVVIVPSSFQ